MENAISVGEYKYNMLNSAVELNDIKGVKALLLKYPSHVNLPLNDGRTPLHYAVIKNNVRMMQLLIAHNAEINPKASHSDRETLSPLWLAMLFNNRQAAECLILSGAKVNERFGIILSKKWQHYDFDPQSTVLHVAVHRQDAELARLLIRHGADLSARNSRNRTPLYDALIADCPVDLIREMINLGARHELTHVDHLNRTYLHPVISAANEDLTELLLEQPEIQATLVNRTGKTTLHFAAEAQWESVKIAVMLLKNGVDINARDDVYGNSALHLALRTGKLQMAKLLIERGADINTKNHEGFFPLYLAAERSNLHILELLISKGANLAQQTPVGQTALHIACINGFEDKIKILLIHGLDPLIKDEIDRTAFQMLRRDRIGAARQMVKRLAAVKIAEKRPIDEEHLELVKAWKLQDYFNECAFEIMTMKHRKMYNDITLFYVFATSNDNLVRLMRNEEFLQSFKLRFSEYKSSLYKEYFPPKLKRAEKIMKSSCAVENHLRLIFADYIADVPLRSIAKWLTVEDLPQCKL